WGADTLAPFVLRADKSYFFSEDNRAFLAYRVVGGVAIVSGDPVGPPAAFEELVRAFIAFAHTRDWRIAILGASGRWLGLYRAHRLHALYHGDEAVIDIAAFSLEGRPIRKVRQSVHRLQRAGYRASVFYPHEIDAALRSRLESVASEWRNGEPNRGFAMALDAPCWPSRVGSSSTICSCSIASSFPAGSGGSSSTSVAATCLESASQPSRPRRICRSAGRRKSDRIARVGPRSGSRFGGCAQLGFLHTARSGGGDATVDGSPSAPIADAAVRQQAVAGGIRDGDRRLGSLRRGARARAPLARAGGLGRRHWRARAARPASHRHPALGPGIGRDRPGGRRPGAARSLPCRTQRGGVVLVVVGRDRRLDLCLAARGRAR